MTIANFHRPVRPHAFTLLGMLLIHVMTLSTVMAEQALDEIEHIAHPSGYGQKELLEARQAGAWIYLGANGEFVAPISDRDGYMGADAAIIDDDGQLIVVECINSFAIYARIAGDGSIHYEPVAKEITGQSAAPLKWPFKKPDGTLSPIPAKGAILASTLVDIEKSTPGPTGNAGWVVLGINERLLVPSRETKLRPRDVLWVMPEKDGFRLVQSVSGKNREFMRVDSTRAITFGQNVKGLSENERYGRYWVYVVRENGRPAIVAPGSMSTRGYSSADISIIIEDGETVGMVTH